MAIHAAPFVGCAWLIGAVFLMRETKCPVQEMSTASTGSSHGHGSRGGERHGQKSGHHRGEVIMETTSTTAISEDPKLLEKTAEEKSEGLRLLFRNKYVQTEAAFWNNKPAPSAPSFPEG